MSSGVVGGLSEGLNLGMNLARAKHQAERQPIEDANRDRMNALNETLQTMRVEDLADARSRKQMMRDVAMARMELENLGTTGQWDEPTFAEAMSRVRHAELNQGGPDGATKSINRIVPTEDGTGFMVDLKVKHRDADGGVYYAPLTVNRSTDPKDPVAVFKWEDAMRDLDARQALLHRLDQIAVAYGDDNALKSNLEQLKHRNNLDLEKTKHGFRMDELKERGRQARAVGRGSRSESQWFYDTYVNDMGMAPREAMARVEKFKRMARTNPQGLLSAKQRIIADMMKANELKEPDDPGYISPDEAEARADRMLQEITDQYSGSDLVGDFPVNRGDAPPAIGRRSKPSAPPASSGYDPAAFGPVTSQPRVIDSQATRVDDTSGASPTAPALGGTKDTAPPLPPQALDALKQAGGKAVKFKNGQIWRMGPDGNPARVQ